MFDRLCENIIDEEVEIITFENFEYVIINILNIISLHFTFYLYCFKNKSAVINIIGTRIDKSEDCRYIEKLKGILTDIIENISFFIYRNEIYEYLFRNNDLYLQQKVLEINFRLKLCIKNKDNIFKITISKFKNNKNYHFGENVFDFTTIATKYPDDIFELITEKLYGTLYFSHFILDNISYSDKNGIFNYNSKIRKISINNLALYINDINIRYVCNFFDTLPKIIYEKFS